MNTLRHFQKKKKARSLIKCFGYLIHVMSQVMFQHTPILLLRFTCVNFPYKMFFFFIVNFYQKQQKQHQKHIHFHLQLVFFSYVAFIILYSPNSNLLDNVGVLLRLDSLCYVYSQTIFFSYKFIYNGNNNNKRHVCLYYYRSPSHVCKTERTHHTPSFRFSLSHHGAYSLIITISIYSIHKTVYSNFQNG